MYLQCLLCPVIYSIVHDFNHYRQFKDDTISFDFCGPTIYFYIPAFIEPLCPIISLNISIIILYRLYIMYLFLGKINNIANR